MTPYHTVKARLKTSWFFPSVMVYDIEYHYEVWYDPSYGNGGGDYRPCTKKISTHRDRAKAEELCLTLNELNGEKK